MKINPLIPFFLKRKRIEKKLTLDHVVKNINFDKTYLSKIENNKIVPNERKLKQLYHFYGEKSYNLEYINFDEFYLAALFNKLYSMDLDISTLDKAIEDHNHSVYLGHLCLIKWCYKSLNGLWDDEFLSDMKSFINLLDFLTIDEQNFFLLCLMFYYTRSKQFDNFNNVYTTLKEIEKRKWLGLEYYIIVSYNYNINNFSSMPIYIEKAKAIFKSENNHKRLNSVLQYEGIYYNVIGDYENEIQVYNTLSKSYLKDNQLVNYGVTEQNIASLLLNQKKYDEAIIHYIEGLKYNDINSSHFELAWCYYIQENQNLCKKAIKDGKKAKKIVPAYNELLDWLLKMLDKPYTKSCLNLLLKIENEYASMVNEETINFIYIAIANNYKELNEMDKAYHYLAKVINKNIITPLNAK